MKTQEKDNWKASIHNKATCCRWSGVGASVAEGGDPVGAGPGCRAQDGDRAGLTLCPADRTDPPPGALRQDEGRVRRDEEG